MRRLGPGMVDAGASSAATFVAGVAAARMLDLPELGVYALIFAGLLLTTQLPTQLVLSPTEARLVERHASERPGFLLSAVAAAMPWALLAGVLTLGLGFLVGDDEGSASRLVLTVTGALATVFSPIQDHVRRMLHLAGRHWSAAWISVARAAIVGVSILLGSVFDLPAALLPLGSLALGDLFSMLPVLLSPNSRASRLPFRSSDLRISGTWLLVSSLAAPAAGFIASFAVTVFAGESALGLAEAARVTAQPLLVLAAGMAAVLGPQAMEAAHRRDRARANALTRRMTVILGSAMVLYVGCTLLPESINPVMWAVGPRAFELPWLTQLSILAAAANAVVLLQRSELVVLDRTKSLAGSEVVAGAVRGALGATAAWIHAWAVPVGFLAGGLTRVALFNRSLRQDQRELV